MGKMIQERIKELSDVMHLAYLEGRYDVVKQVGFEIRELQAESNILKLQTPYQSEPISQIVSDHINNLIATYGREKIGEVIHLFNFKKVG